MSTLEYQLSQAGYAYDNRMPDEDLEAELLEREVDRILENHAELADILEESLPRPVAEFLAHAAIHWQAKWGYAWGYYGYPSDDALRKMVEDHCKKWRDVP